jgi:uncharacterized protein (TIGR02270 family)
MSAGTAVNLAALIDGMMLSWLMRAGGVHASNVRLVDLVRRDERVDAHLDATRVLGERCRDVLMAHYNEGDSFATFPLAYLAVCSLSTDGVALAEKLLSDCRLPPRSSEDKADPGSGGSAIAVVTQFMTALSWVELPLVRPLIGRLLAEQRPVARYIAIGVLGNRRASLDDDVLARLRTDPSPLVRSRAYRTTGQLGRADLMAQLRPGLTDEDPECRFWSAWAAARMGAGGEALDALADIAWNHLPRADRALDFLLRRLDVPQANAWLREFAKIPTRHRVVIRATGAIGDPLYIPWLIERMTKLETARLAGEAFSMITGLDLAYRDLDRKPPQDFESGPNDDPADENVALDEDAYLPWPDPEKIGQWWAANRSRFDVGTPYFLGTPKPAADWLEALSDAFQRQRHAAALELAIRQPDKAMFEVRARGRLQRQLIARARGLA